MPNQRITLAGAARVSNHSDSITCCVAEPLVHLVVVARLVEMDFRPLVLTTSRSLSVDTLPSFEASVHAMITLSAWPGGMTRDEFTSWWNEAYDRAARNTASNSRRLEIQLTR